MKLYIAKHYWKDNEKATWEVHKKINKELFEYLKRNYSRFEREKPRQIIEGKYFIYLCYKKGTEKEAYRSFTNITFFIALKEIPINFLKKEKLCKKATAHNLEIKLQDIKTMIIKLGIIIVLLSSIYVFQDNINFKFSKIEKTTINPKEHPNYINLATVWNTQI